MDPRGFPTNLPEFQRAKPNGVSNGLSGELKLRIFQEVVEEEQPNGIRLWGLGLANLGNDSRGTRRDVAGSITPSASVRHKQRVAAKKASINGVDIADLATTVE